MGTRGTEQHRVGRAGVTYAAAEEAGGYSRYPEQYAGQYAGGTGQQSAYATAVRQPRAQARGRVRAQAATPYPETPVYDPARSGGHDGSRASRAWQAGELDGGSDASPPRIRVARVVDAWPDAYPGELPPDPYDPYTPYGASPSAARMSAGGRSATVIRERVTARPVTREQRTVVIEHPWDEPLSDERFGVDQIGADEYGADESGVREFSRELDALIATTSAQQRVVLPKAAPATGARSARRLGRIAALGVRAGLAFLILMGIMTGITALTGHPPIPLPALPLPLLGLTDPGADLHLSVDANLLTRIAPLTQLKRADQYDNTGQFHAWGGSACSAAVMAETLTAYSVPNATIGRMIDEMGSDISQQWGLVSYDGFARVAAKHSLRADMYTDHPLTYKQMLYITNTLHVPLIVNVRATSGYYHYLSGGHFLVMTGGDAQTIRLVDSSEYYIKSLPIATFMGMYRNRSVAIVPKDFQYTLPA